MRRQKKTSIETYTDTQADRQEDRLTKDEPEVHSAVKTTKSMRSPLNEIPGQTHRVRNHVGDDTGVDGKSFEWQGHSYGQSGTNPRIMCLAGKRIDWQD